MEIKKNLFLILILTIVFCSGCLTQEETKLGQISGTITLEGQTSYAGVTVFIEGASSCVTTEASGEYVFSSLSSGSYNLSAVKSGFETSSLKNIPVEAGKTTASTNFQLNLSIPEPPF